MKLKKKKFSIFNRFLNFNDSPLKLKRWLKNSLRMINYFQRWIATETREIAKLFTLSSTDLFMRHYRRFICPRMESQNEGNRVVF